MATDDPLPPILCPLPEELLGPRVLLRPPRAGDGAATWEAIEETRAQLRLWLPWVDQTHSVEDCEAAARRGAARWLLREDLQVRVWDRATGRFLGGSGLHRIRWEVPSFEIGYWLRASAQGQGLMTEAVTVLCRFALDSLAANRIEIRCDARNGSSAALPRRLGFIHEATLRNECRDTEGRLRDTLVFALTPQDQMHARGSALETLNKNIEVG